MAILEDHSGVPLVRVFREPQAQYWVAVEEFKICCHNHLTADRSTVRRLKAASNCTAGDELDCTDAWEPKKSSSV